MKTTSSILIALLVAMSASAESLQFGPDQYGSELRGSVNGYAPEFGLYDYAAGVDFQYRNWYWDPVGFALGVGLSSWQVKDGSFTIGRTEALDLGGELLAIPVGPSIIYKMADFADGNLTAEAGVRYVFTQSNVHYRRETTEERANLDLEEGSIALLGLDYEHVFYSGASFFVGAGYQVDIDSGTIQVSDLGSTDNKLEGLFARIGTKMEF